jgi:hypothetical protein
VVCLGPRAPGESVGPRLQSGACARPLNFTVRSHRESRLETSALALEVRAVFDARWSRLRLGLPFLFVIVLSACTSPGLVNAPSDSGATRSLCESAAGTWFKKRYARPEEHTPMGSSKATYTSHFSSSKSSCFVETVATAHLKAGAATKTVDVDSEIHELVDLKTEEQLGQLVIQSTQSAPLWCEVGKVKCWSAKEWDALVGPYMKD